ncbi:hypothetical protein HK102_000963 [Quaeritorhiza haematococci]|nr:hypothetical protein HK102_000963 [Quaeritorhiza haematococci]
MDRSAQTRPRTRATPRTEPVHARKRKSDFDDIFDFKDDLIDHGRTRSARTNAATSRVDLHLSDDDEDDDLKRALLLSKAEQEREQREILRQIHQMTGNNDASASSVLEAEGKQRRNKGTIGRGTGGKSADPQRTTKAETLHFSKAVAKEKGHLDSCDDDEEAFQSFFDKSTKKVPPKTTYRRRTTGMDFAPLSLASRSPPQPSLSDSDDQVANKSTLSIPPKTKTPNVRPRPKYQSKASVPGSASGCGKVTVRKLQNIPILDSSSPSFDPLAYQADEDVIGDKERHHRHEIFVSALRRMYHLGNRPSNNNSPSTEGLEEVKNKELETLTIKESQTQRNRLLPTSMATLQDLAAEVDDEPKVEKPRKRIRKKSVSLKEVLSGKKSIVSDSDERESQRTDRGVGLGKKEGKDVCKRRTPEASSQNRADNKDKRKPCSPAIRGGQLQNSTELHGGDLKTSDPSSASIGKKEKKRSPPLYFSDDDQVSPKRFRTTVRSIRAENGEHIGDVNIGGKEELVNESESDEAPTPLIDTRALKNTKNVVSKTPSKDYIRKQAVPVEKMEPPSRQSYSRVSQSVRFGGGREGVVLAVDSPEHAKASKNPESNPLAERVTGHDTSSFLDRVEDTVPPALTFDDDDDFGDDVIHIETNEPQSDRKASQPTKLFPLFLRNQTSRSPIGQSTKKKPDEEMDVDLELTSTDSAVHITSSPASSSYQPTLSSSTSAKRRKLLELRASRLAKQKKYDDIEDDSYDEEESMVQKIRKRHKGKEKQQAQEHKLTPGYDDDQDAMPGANILKHFQKKPKSELTTPRTVEIDIDETQPVALRNKDVDADVEEFTSAAQDVPICLDDDIMDYNTLATRNSDSETEDFYGYGDGDEGAEGEDDEDEGFGWEHNGEDGPEINDENMIPYDEEFSPPDGFVNYQELRKQGALDAGLEGYFRQFEPKSSRSSGSSGGTTSRTPAASGTRQGRISTTGKRKPASTAKKKGSWRGRGRGKRWGSNRGGGRGRAASRGSGTGGASSRMPAMPMSTNLRQATLTTTDSGPVKLETKGRSSGRSISATTHNHYADYAPGFTDSDFGTRMEGIGGVRFF